MQALQPAKVLLDVQNITLHVSRSEFERLCLDNPELRLELSSSGELIAMPPAGWGSSRRNSELNRLLGNWNNQFRSGQVFDSSGGFTLPNGAIRSPDVTWISNAKLKGLSEEDAFPEVVPDFVIELRSKTDSLKTLQRKMEEYRMVGVKLGWLVDPQNQQVEIYRVGKEVEVVRSPQADRTSSPTILEGEDILPGLAIAVDEILG